MEYKHNWRKTEMRMLKNEMVAIEYFCPQCGEIIEETYTLVSPKIPETGCELVSCFTGNLTSNKVRI